MTKWKSCSNLSMEEYLEFLASHSEKERIHAMLTIGSLNQIIFIHGFKRIHNTAKKLLVEAVEAIDPVTPWRSTLGEAGVTPMPASIGKEEIVADLEELKWQECGVTSVRTLEAKSKPKQKSLTSGRGGNGKKQKRTVTHLSAAEAEAEASLAIGSGNCKKWHLSNN